ncbi:MAG: hypothetical protein EBZ47_00760 [Chlamydiae bacterium]|nr:hypothetical protein [Chlamydiota bacterium]
MAILDTKKAEIDQANTDYLFGGELSQDTVTLHQKIKAASQKKDRLFSLICIRLFFLFLLFADVIWSVFCLTKIFIGLLMATILFFKKTLWLPFLIKACLSWRRSLVCALSLFVSLFSTGFGIMIACTYFVMYDKDGIEEVIPASLQGHFKDFFNGPIA